MQRANRKLRATSSQMLLTTSASQRESEAHLCLCAMQHEELLLSGCPFHTRKFCLLHATRALLVLFSQGCCNIILPFFTSAPFSFVSHVSWPRMEALQSSGVFWILLQRNDEFSQLVENKSNADGSSSNFGTSYHKDRIWEDLGNVLLHLWIYTVTTSSVKFYWIFYRSKLASCSSRSENSSHWGVEGSCWGSIHLLVKNA